MADTDILNVGRIHFHECSVFQENACDPFRYLGRELAVRIEFSALRRAPHQRYRGCFQSRKKALFVERKQGFNATEDNFPFGCGDDSFFAGTNTTDEVDRGGTGLHVNVNEFLQPFDISPFGPVQDISFSLKNIKLELTLRSLERRVPVSPCRP